MKHSFRLGQYFTLTNPDAYVMDEVWTVTAINDLVIEFSCWKRWLVDAAYVNSESIQPYTVKVIKEDASGVIVADRNVS